MFTHSDVTISDKFSPLTTIGLRVCIIHPQALLRHHHQHLESCPISCLHTGLHLMRMLHINGV